MQQTIKMAVSILEIVIATYKVKSIITMMVIYFVFILEVVHV